MIEDAEFIPNVGDLVDAGGMEWAVLSRKFIYNEKGEARHSAILIVQPVPRK